MSTSRCSQLGPTTAAVLGMTCMRPTAPSLDTWSWRQPLSHQETASSKLGSTPSCWAAVTRTARIDGGAGESAG